MKYIFFPIALTILLASCSQQNIDNTIAIPNSPVSTIQTGSMIATQSGISQTGTVSTGSVNTGSVIAKVRTLWMKYRNNGNNIVLQEERVPDILLTEIAYWPLDWSYPWCGKEGYNWFIEYKIISGSGTYGLVQKQKIACGNLQWDNGTTFFAIKLTGQEKELIDLNKALSKKIPIQMMTSGVFDSSVNIYIESVSDTKIKVSIEPNSGIDSSELFKKWWWIIDCGWVCQTEAYTKEFDIWSILTEAQVQNNQPKPQTSQASINGKYRISENMGTGGWHASTITISNISDTQFSISFGATYEADNPDNNKPFWWIGNGRKNGNQWRITLNENDYGNNCTATMVFTANSLTVSNMDWCSSLPKGTYKKQ